MGTDLGSDKHKREKFRIRDLAKPSLTVLLVAAIVLLALYSIGILDTGEYHFVDKMEYAEGGFSFTGSLKDGYFNDNGIIVFNEGHTYNGGFTDGRFDGEAVYSDATDKWWLRGEFQSGRFSNGQLFLGDGLTVIYEIVQNTNTVISPTWQYNGGLNERGQNGSGRFTFEDGSIYIGDFMNGLAYGEGMFVDAEGNTLYTGQFLNGFFDGAGVYYSTEGWVYQGDFKEGMFDGEGILFIDDTVVHGIWEKGVQITRFG